MLAQAFRRQNNTRHFRTGLRHDRTPSPATEQHWRCIDNYEMT
nr:hypothetical protein JVH1_6706 [Rhodococcus sp. JVH1]